MPDGKGRNSMNTPVSSEDVKPLSVEDAAAMLLKHSVKRLKSIATKREPPRLLNWLNSKRNVVLMPAQADSIWLNC